MCFFVDGADWGYGLAYVGSLNLGLSYPKSNFIYGLTPLPLSFLTSGVALGLVWGALNIGLVLLANGYVA